MCQTSLYLLTLDLGLLFQCQVTHRANTASHYREWRITFDCFGVERKSRREESRLLFLSCIFKAPWKPGSSILHFLRSSSFVLLFWFTSSLHWFSFNNSQCIKITQKSHLTTICDKLFDQKNCGKRNIFALLCIDNFDLTRKIAEIREII